MVFSWLCELGSLLGVVFLYVDGFLDINNVCGYVIGDFVL